MYVSNTGSTTKANKATPVRKTISGFKLRRNNSKGLVLVLMEWDFLPRWAATAGIGDFAFIASNRAYDLASTGLAGLNSSGFLGEVVVFGELCRGESS